MFILHDENEVPKPFWPFFLKVLFLISIVVDASALKTDTPEMLLFDIVEFVT